MEPLRIGVVGGGAIGQHNALKAVESRSATVVGVFDTNPKVCRDLARKLSCRGSTSYDGLLEMPEVEAVLLSVPHHLHRDLSIQAASKRKHVLLEKPIANTLREAEDIIEACRAAGVTLTVNFSFRYLPRIQLARKLVQQGALGTIRGVQVIAHSYREKGYWLGARSSSPDDWRTSKEKAGAGFLFMNLCHTIDYTYFVTALKANRVYCEYDTLGSPTEVEDSVSITCRFDNGAIGTFGGSTVRRGPNQEEERIWGSQGSLWMNGEGLFLYSTRPIEGKQPGKVHRWSRFPSCNWTGAWIQAAASAIREGREPEISGQQGWENLAFIATALDSMSKQVALHVPTRFGEGR